MDNSLKQKVDLMVENYYDIKRTFKLDSNIIKYFTALNLANKNSKIDIARITEIQNYIKKEAGIFSDFKGINLFDLSSLLHLENDYKTFFKNMKIVYEKMLNMGFKKSIYLPLASYTVVKDSKETEWDQIIKRMNEFYSNMKKNHFWLTSKDDYILVAVLAVSNLAVQKTCEEMENCYNYLNSNGFSKGNSLQTLSHILSLGEEDAISKCDKVITLKEYLKKENCKISHDALISLGVLSFVTIDEGKISKEIRGVYEYIRKKDSYGKIAIQKSHVIMLAMSLVSEFYIERLKNGVIDTTLANTLNSIIIAQEQTAIIIGAVIGTTSIATV